MMPEPFVIKDFTSSVCHNTINQSEDLLASVRFVTEAAVLFFLSYSDCLWGLPRQRVQHDILPRGEDNH
jgi:hypothetical protein